MRPRARAAAPGPRARPSARSRRACASTPSRSVYLTDRTTASAERRRALRRARGAGARGRRRPGRSRSSRPCAARSRCATRARTTSRRSRCRTGTRGRRRRSRRSYAEYGRLYEGFYGYRLDGIPIELVRLSVVAMGEPPVFAGLPSEEARGRGRGAPRRLLPRDRLRRHRHRAPRARSSRARRAPGPLIVESMDSTVVVPPGWTLAVAASGILDLTRA